MPQPGMPLPPFPHLLIAFICFPLPSLLTAAEGTIYSIVTQLQISQCYLGNLIALLPPLQPFRYQDNLIEKRRCLLLCEEQSGNLIQPLSAQLYTNLWHNNEQTKTLWLVLTTKVIRARFSQLQLLKTCSFPHDKEFVGWPKTQK